MLKRQAVKRLGKKARRGFRGYPVATIAFYGPDNRMATKVAVALVLAAEQEPAELRRWLSDDHDVRKYRAAVKDIQAEKEFSYRQRLGEDSIQLVAGMQAIHSDAINKLERPRALMGEQSGRPILATAKGVGQLWKRRSAAQALSELSLQPVSGT